MGEVIEQHDGLKWSDKRNLTMILSYHDAEVQTITKWDKVKHKPATNT
jgi:predicted GTPase